MTEVLIKASPNVNLGIKMHTEFHLISNHLKTFNLENHRVILGMLAPRLKIKKVAAIAGHHLHRYRELSVSSTHAH